MNFVSLSSGRRTVAGVEHISNDQRDCSRRASRNTLLARGGACHAALLLVAFSAIGCGDSGDPGYGGGLDAGSPIYTAPGGGGYDAGYPGNTPGVVSPGQSYTLDSGFGVGSFGGTNGNVGGLGTAGGGTATVGGLTGGLTAGLTGGTSGLTGGVTGGGSTPLGGLGGLLGGLGGGGAALGGLTGGGGTTTPTMPLDPSVKKPADSKLPKVNGACPDLSRSGTVQVAGSTVVLTVGTKPGPVYFYFHGTGTTPDEVDQALPGVTANVRANGGIVASWETSNEKGESTGSVWAVWFTGDFEAADQILACGIQKGIVDTGRIHVSGYSAGGLQAGAMLFMRSNYIASGIVYSGGKGFGAGALQDPSNAPAVLGSHGAQGSDWLILDFSDGTKSVEQELKKAGAFAADCDDGGSHIDFALGRAGLNGKATQFLVDHPYNTKPSPYAGGMPAGFPSNCKVQ